MGWSTGRCYCHYVAADLVYSVHVSADQVGGLILGLSLVTCVPEMHTQ